MKKEINQDEGVNQVALVNSNENEITIINSPIEYMSWLIENGKLKEASEVFAKLYKQAEKIHPLHPNYTYKPVEFGSKLVFEHRPANKQIAEQLPLKHKGSFSIKDKDISNSETFRELLTRKYFSQEKISIDMKRIETWIGDKLIDNPFSLEQHAVKEAEWFIVPEKLPPPIKTKLVVSENEIDRVIIDYIELRVIDISKKEDEDKITISNIHQENSPIVLSLTLPCIFSNELSIMGSSKFDFKVRENFEGTVIGEKTFLELMKYTNQSSKLILIEIEQQKEFFKAEDMNLNNPQDSKYTDDRIAILSELMRIENTLEVQFQLPEKMGHDDFEKIEILKAIVENKEIITEIDKFSTVFDNKDVLQKMVYNIKDKPITITDQEDKEIELFGVKFDNIEALYTFENLIVKNPERVRKKLEYFEEGETVKVEFKPGTKNFVKIRYKIRV